MLTNAAICLSGSLVDDGQLCEGQREEDVRARGPEWSTTVGGWDLTAGSQADGLATRMAVCGHGTADLDTVSAG